MFRLDASGLRLTLPSVGQHGVRALPLGVFFLSTLLAFSACVGDAHRPEDMPGRMSGQPVASPRQERSRVEDLSLEASPSGSLGTDRAEARSALEDARDWAGDALHQEQVRRFAEAEETLAQDEHHLGEDLSMQSSVHTEDFARDAKERFARSLREEHKNVSHPSNHHVPRSSLHAAFDEVETLTPDDEARWRSRIGYNHYKAFNNNAQNFINDTYERVNDNNSLAHKAYKGSQKYALALTGLRKMIANFQHSVKNFRTATQDYHAAGVEWVNKGYEKAHAELMANGVNVNPHILPRAHEAVFQEERIGQDGRRQEAQVDLEQALDSTQERMGENRGRQEAGAALESALDSTRNRLGG